MSTETAVRTTSAPARPSAWDRLTVLFDPGTFTEIGARRRHRSHSLGMENKRPPGDGVVTGWGLVNGRKVCAYAHENRIFGGSLGEAHADKIHRIQDLAESSGCPIVGINDGAGARIQEGVLALAGYGGIFRRIVRSSGVIPQISIVVGPCAGGAAYAPALTDFVYMTEKSSTMYITGPGVVRTVTGEDVSHEQLGGARVHAHLTGVATARCADEADCFDAVRDLLGYLPDNRECWPPDSLPLLPAIPGGPRTPAGNNQAYNVYDVIAAIFDDAWHEVHAEWAQNIVCGFSRLNGRAVGVVANQPMVNAGAIDISASEKAARFVQLCDAFNIPLITLVDVPGFLPGTDQEHHGIIRHGAKLLHAYCAATVPRIQVIMRKAYGGAYIVMDSRPIGSDLVFAWPGNNIAVMGAEAAVDVIFRKDIANSANPGQVRKARIKEYGDSFLYPEYAAEVGLVDEVIEPPQTRDCLIKALDLLATKEARVVPRKHGNQPT